MAVASISRNGPVMRFLNTNAGSVPKCSEESREHRMVVIELQAIGPPNEVDDEGPFFGSWENDFIPKYQVEENECSTSNQNNRSSQRNGMYQVAALTALRPQRRRV